MSCFQNIGLRYIFPDGHREWSAAQWTGYSTSLMITGSLEFQKFIADFCQRPMPSSALANAWDLIRPESTSDDDDDEPSIGVTGADLAKLECFLYEDVYKKILDKQKMDEGLSRIKIRIEDTQQVSYRVYILALHLYLDYLMDNTLQPIVIVPVSMLPMFDIWKRLLDAEASAKNKSITSTLWPLQVIRYWNSQQLA